MNYLNKFVIVNQAICYSSLTLKAIAPYFIHHVNNRMKITSFDCIKVQLLSSGQTVKKNRLLSKCQNIIP
jgi:hypothetical protein